MNCTLVVCCHSGRRRMEQWKATNGTVEGDEWNSGRRRMEQPSPGGVKHRDPRENPPTNGIVRHDSHIRKSGVNRPSIETGSPWWEASREIAQTIVISKQHHDLQQRSECGGNACRPRWKEDSRGMKRRPCPGGRENQYQERPDEPFLPPFPSSSLAGTGLCVARGGLVVRLLISHPGEPGSIPGGVARGFSHVGIVPYDAAGRRVFSGISHFPRTWIPALLHTHVTALSSALKTSMLRAAQISPLHLNYLLYILIFKETAHETNGSKKPKHGEHTCLNEAVVTLRRRRCDFQREDSGPILQPASRAVVQHTSPSQPTLLPRQLTTSTRLRFANSKPGTISTAGGEAVIDFVGGSGHAALILADQQAHPADVRRGSRQTHPHRSEGKPSQTANISSTSYGTVGFDFRSISNKLDDGSTARRFSALLVWATGRWEPVLLSPVSLCFEHGKKYHLGLNLSTRGDVAARASVHSPQRRTGFDSRRDCSRVFRTWESYRHRLLFGRLSRVSPVSPTLAFRRCSVPISFDLHRNRQLSPRSIGFVDTHKTPCDRVKRCWERKRKIKALECVNVSPVASANRTYVASLAISPRIPLTK
ncbi:hypothetical protein PR048_032440 [Dryococelus australis]|uniref:Uncharacterized protein n=1 Tax=Dryococelus australis TaxID=614101 RepID=A0ABQ9G6C6_9NEOP|nr:hypothetical protein PR048_032440 [Dryococelus australis]